MHVLLNQTVLLRGMSGSIFMFMYVPPTGVYVLSVSVFMSVFVSLFMSVSISMPMSGSRFILIFMFLNFMLILCSFTKLNAHVTCLCDMSCNIFISTFPYHP
jgi:hypothetical protein